MIGTKYYCIFTGYSWGQPGRIAKYNDHFQKGPPEFDDISPVEVSVMLGQAAFLPCKVRNLGDKLVSNLFNCHTIRVINTIPAYIDLSGAVISPDTNRILNQSVFLSNCIRFIFALMQLVSQFCAFRSF